MTNIFRDPFGNIVLPRGKDWLQSVSENFVSGYSPLDKFGYNPLITTASDPETIWEGSNNYTYSTTADIVSIASSDAGDDQDVKIYGLDENGEDVSQTVTLNGTTRVALTTALYRVYRMENMGTTSFAGNVVCYTGTGAIPAIGASNSRAVIIDGNNQTLMALYTIPLGKVGFLYRGEVGILYTGTAFSANEYAIADYRSRRLGEVFKIKKRISLSSGANCLFQDHRSFPDVVPALTDIEIRITEVSADMGAWATFDLLLVDEDQLSPEFLTAIGQPSSLT